MILFSYRHPMRFLEVRTSMVAIWLFAAATAFGSQPRTILTPKAPGRTVDEPTMQRIYDEVKTPYKYGVVLKGGEGKMVDCPSVFFVKPRWYMLYVCMNKVGYETHLAQSGNLLQWTTLGKVLSFSPSGWDQWQADGGAALVDHTWGGSAELQKFKGRYWLSYIGGAKQGYEPDPLAIGIAWTKEPTKSAEWQRLPENPVLSTEQTDVREFEKKTLYKSTIIWDKSKSLGFPLVMFYNGKLKNGFERIGMAVSDDMVHWQRYGPDPVVANGEEKRNGMSGDPQIVRVGDVWVMFYFGAGWKPKAFDTFACSYDLVHWTKWTGDHMVAPSEPYDEQYAHKPWVLKHDGVVYHFYCAVGDEGRVIALATSRPLQATRGPLDQ